MTEALDRRVQRTRQLLRDALFDLIVERGYEPISVQDITERANLGRATFYLHYKDKEGLLLDALERISVELADLAARDFPLDDLRRGRSPSLLVFQHVADHRGLYRALLGARGAAIVIARQREILTDLAERLVTSELAAQAPNPLPPALLAHFAAGALQGLLIWWLEHDLPYPPEEMARLYFELLTRGQLAMLGDDQASPPI